jgi:putative oxidoreductase
VQKGEEVMPANSLLPVALLTLRLTVFLVMLVWTLDKFFAPEHAAGVYEMFYFIDGLSPAVMYVIGAVELVIIAGFVLGIAKRFTYAAVFAFHAVSTLASFPLYLNPAEGRLFYAAWPMLAACFTLYVLRDLDTMWTLKPHVRAAAHPPAA